MATHLALLAAALLSTVSAKADVPASTREFEVRGDRAFLGGRPVRLWGIRAGNALYSQAVTERFVRNLDNMAAHGLNALMVYVQGSNTGWPYEWGARNGFEDDGRLKPAFAARLEWLIREADRRGMVVGVGIFTPRNDQNLASADVIRRALQETGRFLEERKLKNVFVDIMHEYNHRRVHLDIFKEPGGPEKKAALTRWFKEAAPDIEAGICAAADTNTQPGYPGADILIIQKASPIPPTGFVVNVEMLKRDNYDTEGVFSPESFDVMYKTFEQYRRAENAAFFFHSGFIQGVSGRDGSAPHAEMGGDGTSVEERGVKFYYDWVLGNVGRWSYPRHRRTPRQASR